MKIHLRNANKIRTKDLEGRWVKKKTAETERSRSIGVHSAEADEGKFHVSVWLSQRDQVFGIVANVFFFLSQSNISHHVDFIWVKKSSI